MIDINVGSILTDIVIYTLLTISSISTILIILEAHGFLPPSITNWVYRNRIPLMAQVLRKYIADQDTIREDSSPSNTRLLDRIKSNTLKFNVEVGRIEGVQFPEYIDLQGATTNTSEAIFFARRLAGHAKKHGKLWGTAGEPAFDFIVAPKLGSPILAYEFAQLVDRPLGLHVDEEKFRQIGTRTSRDFRFKAQIDFFGSPPRPGSEALLLDDSTTGGRKILSAAKFLREHGYEVRHCLTVFSPVGKNVKTLLLNDNIELVTLYDGPKSIGC